MSLCFYLLVPENLKDRLRIDPSIVIVTEVHDDGKRVCVQNEDGLIVQKNGELAEADGEVRVISGMLESSNVNAITEMVNMMSLARQYEMQVKLMKKAEEMDQSSSQLMRLNG